MRERDEDFDKQRALRVIIAQNARIIFLLRGLTQLEGLQMARDTVWHQKMLEAAEADTSAKNAMITAFNAQADKLQELLDQGADPTELQAFVDTVKANAKDLTDAIAARTPIENEPAPSPAPETPADTGGTSTETPAEPTGDQ